MTAMKYITCSAVAISVYSAYLLISRYGGWNSTALDWTFLVLSVLSVLLWPAVRSGNPKHTMLFMVVLSLILFFWAFWFLALVFGEGL